MTRGASATDADILQMGAPSLWALPSSTANPDGPSLDQGRTEFRGQRLQALGQL